MQDSLNGNDYAATVDAIGQLRTAVTAAAEDHATEAEFRASLELSKGVASTMGSLADAVRAAQERIDGMDPEPPERDRGPGSGGAGARAGTGRSGLHGRG